MVMPSFFSKFVSDDQHTHEEDDPTNLIEMLASGNLSPEEEDDLLVQSLATHPVI